MSERREIPWFAPAFGGDEERRVAAVIRSGFVNDGPATREFEHAIAQIAGVRHCVAVTSGTAAISLALMAKGIGPGDEVIVPDLTFIATANAVSMTGATVKLADVNPRTLTLDLAGLSAAVTPATRAVVPVDVNGRGADYAAIEPFCRERGLVLITDSAEALGSGYRQRPLGSIGDAGCFSFSPNKFITTGQGGMIATNSDAVRDRLIELKDQGRPRRGTGGDDLHPASGFNFKLTDLQGALGLAQLQRLDERIARARERDRWYRARLSQIEGVRFPDDASGEDEVRLWADILVSDRQAVRAAFDAHSIGYRAFWYPLHRQAPYHIENDDGFRQSIAASEAGLWLPSAFDITESDVARVCDILRQAAGE
ncbi:DegT/DnrJ/EryC1/StrS family aminotransferase [Rubrivivax sp. JA1024]|nr:DegT/DnrJ/EryC1/StrS family aminotransferase [Rubrivivax sp. JA1024]